ncbi:hypothetical protein I7I50_02668 [Histoplasma capsulatum G186AR]|uniref:Uncharacterized protein n=1 Tax=Ajellomyces capsulatus TaxID=5037 RepID=A0A8H8D6K4_AJECA|nr:hypothetical protein I7I52_00666 [Histoplasma capsulatum]QSS71716.1 hypothetical protein I7I50_02668 [Histoplasma capsulatum G186AR]
MHGLVDFLPITPSSCLPARCWATDTDWLRDRQPNHRFRGLCPAVPPLLETGLREELLFVQSPW